MPDWTPNDQIYNISLVDERERTELGQKQTKTCKQNHKLNQQETKINLSECKAKEEAKQRMQEGFPEGVVVITWEIRFKKSCEIHFVAINR